MAAAEHVTYQDPKVSPVEMSEYYNYWDYHTSFMGVGPRALYMKGKHSTQLGRYVHTSEETCVCAHA